MLSAFAAPANAQTPDTDSNEKIEGAQSLRFENPHSQFTGIRTPEVKLENDAYTFSFYAKADRPVRIRIMVLSIEDITGEKRKLSWDNRSVRYFQLNKEWTRYQFQHKKRDPRFQHYLVDFSWGNGNDATVWLDAMQFERGSEMTPYTAYASVESVLYGTKYNRIEGEPPLTYTIEALNRSKEPVMKQYLLTEKNDTTGEVVKQHRFVLEIPPGGKAERSFKTEGGKFGIYSVSGSGVMPFLYGYSPRYIRRSADPQKDFLFGVEFEGNYSFPNLNGGKSYLRLLQADHAEYLKMAENQGHRLIRIGNGSGALFLVWKTHIGGMMVGMIIGLSVMLSGNGMLMISAMPTESVHIVAMMNFTSMRVTCSRYLVVEDTMRKVFGSLQIEESFLTLIMMDLRIWKQKCQG